MFNKKGRLYVVLFTALLFIAIIGFLFAINIPNEGKNPNEEIENQTEEKTCIQDSDCDDGNACTINDCREGKCLEIEVVLCYQNDGCCPENCNQQNDNDCNFS